MFPGEPTVCGHWWPMWEGTYIRSHLSCCVSSIFHTAWGIFEAPQHLGFKWRSRSILKNILPEGRADTEKQLRSQVHRVWARALWQERLSVPMTVIRCCHQHRPGEERVHFLLHFQHSPSLRGARARAQGKNLDEKHCLLLHSLTYSCSANFLTQPSTT